MTKPAAPSATDYSATTLLPKTPFPMRAGLPEREPGWVQRWLDNDVYGKLRAARKNTGKYFHVHLGPPYANGNFHMGHALTYTLKDFIVRSKFMAGYDAPYAPGWDCHGLPIEWKIEQELRKNGKTKADLSLTELRAKCRASAREWIDIQLAEWQRMGCLGDWDGHYETMAPFNEAGIVAELGQMVQRGLVTQQLRSTQWSWAEETAMAEAEVEYKDVTSTAVYVALPLVEREGEFLVIWTTTPWTLPANRAVAVKDDEVYVGVSVGPRTFWVAKALVEACSAALGWDARLIEAKNQLQGKDLVGWSYRHPLYPSVTGKVFHGDHVTTDSGTGMVHIAPAHGMEDYVLGKKAGLDLTCPVDGAGKYEAYVQALPETGEVLAGKLIWPAQKLILKELEETGLLLSAKEFQHSYPVSWRSKEKLIFRTTKQWFVELDTRIPELDGKSIRERSLELIHGRRADGSREVNWVPEYGENRIGSMIAGRPDWCISRQRAWGVPITIMQDKQTNAVMKDPAVWAHIVGLVEKEGIDAWNVRLDGRHAELFPAGWLAANGKTADDFTYVRDILDVWFDSGTTHAHVVRRESGPGQRFERTDGKRPADVYLEGSDQHRGWFHSSLLCSVANYNDAPYETVITNGFVVDGEGRKFSKSLGNGVEPKDLLPKYGMDIIRLWVASADYSEDIRYSPQIMDSMADAYRRFRNTFRWLLGNLHGFDAASHTVAYTGLPELEQYVLHELAGVLAEVRGHIDAYQFHKAIRALGEFCGGTLSNFYFDVRKDVLYCNPENSPERRAVQTVLHHVFGALATHLAPFLPFTADEAWRTLNGDTSCVHMELFTEPAAEWRRDLAFGERWVNLLNLRSEANKAIEASRAAGTVGANTEVELTADVDAADIELLRLVSGVSKVVKGSALSERKHPGHKCPRCWRHYDALEANGVCLRCDEALSTSTAAA